MTASREILPGRYWLVTRRCTQRQFLLRPCKATNDIFNYALAEAAAEFGVEVLAWLVMSNHYHLVVRDVRGVLPKFMHRLNVHLAKCLNVQWKRWENLWSSDAAGATHLVTHEDVFDKIVYTLANPVKADLVERTRQWPGSSSVKVMGGSPIGVKRPIGYFREDGEMPAKVRLKTTLPFWWRDTAEAWRRRVIDALREREDRTIIERNAEGRRVVGVQNVVSASAFDAPMTTEPKRALRPAIACKRKWARIAAISALRTFRIAYRAAREAYVRGEVGVVFPAGTWMMRSLGVVCAPYPAPS